jgi:cytochrome c556
MKTRVIYPPDLLPTGTAHSLLAAVVVAAIGGCSENSRPASNTAGADSSARPPVQQSRVSADASIRELMEYIVDPSADGLWNAVAIVQTQSGTDRREPRTAKEWQVVRAQAVTLVESANLLVLGTRKAAPEGTSAGEGELSANSIDARIAANRVVFEDLAANLRNTARKALAAIDRQDANDLLAVGGEIDVACEACHTTFWYPDQNNLRSAP